jgi:hypothetical protein
MKLSILLLLVLSGCSAIESRQTLSMSDMLEATGSARPATPLLAAPAITTTPKSYSMVAGTSEIATIEVTGTSSPRRKSAIAKHSADKKLIAKSDPTVKSDAVLDQLSSANMMFSGPVNTNITQPIRAQLLIDPTISLEELEKSAVAQSPTISSRIAISKIVIASIVADKFDIKALTPERQAISPTSQTEWLWQLTPKAPGQHEITLSISAVVTVDGNTAERFIKTFEKTVIVEITTMQYIMGFAKQYWQWLWTVLIVPGIVWLRAKLKK